MILMNASECQTNVIAIYGFLLDVIVYDMVEVNLNVHGICMN